MTDVFVRGWWNFAELPVLLQLPFVAMFAGLLGSFVNVCIWRIPRGESIVFPRSHCPRCKTVLGIPDLVPIFSYLALRGRCRHCGAGFSPRYLLIELLLVIAWSAALLTFELTWTFLAVAVGFTILVVLVGIGFVSRSMAGRDRDGFTFIGILLAMSLFVIFIVPFIDIVRTGLVGAIKNRDYLIAYNLARERIEELRLIPVRQLRSDWEVYARGEKLTDNIFVDEFGPLSKWGQDEKVFYENFSDVLTPFSKFPDSVFSKFERNFKQYYGFDYMLYPKDYKVFRRVTRVKDITDPSVPNMVLKQVTVAVTIDSKATQDRTVELSTLYSDLGP